MSPVLPATDPPPPKPWWVQALVLVGFLVLTLGVGQLGGIATSIGQRDGWYDALAKPPLNPPAWVFGPVWTTLYVLMAVAAWRIWRQGCVAPRIGAGPPTRNRALALWGVQLALNLGWSVVFFGLQSPVAGLGVLLILLLVFSAATWDFWVRDRAAGLLMLPTLLWTAFAGYLNAGIIVVN